MANSYLTTEQKAVVYGRIREAVKVDDALPFRGLYQQAEAMARDAEVPTEALLSQRIFQRFHSRLPGTLFPEDRMTHVRPHHEAAAQDFVYRRLSDDPARLATLDRCVEAIRWLDGGVTQFVHIYSNPAAHKVEIDNARELFQLNAGKCGVDDMTAFQVVHALEQHVRKALENVPSPGEASAMRASATAQGHVKLLPSPKNEEAQSFTRFNVQALQSKKSAYMCRVMHYKVVGQALDDYAPDSGCSRAQKAVSVYPELEPLLYKHSSGRKGSVDKQPIPYQIREAHIAVLDPVYATSVDLQAGSKRAHDILQIFTRIFDRAAEVTTMTPEQRNNAHFRPGRIFSMVELERMAEALHKLGAADRAVTAEDYIERAEIDAQILFKIQRGTGQAHR